MNNYNITLITMYPDVFPGYLDSGVAKKAKEKNLWSLRVIDLKDFAIGKKVDDYTYGGGKGLLIRPDVLGDAIEHAFSVGASKNLFYPNPKGKTLQQTDAEEFSKLDGMTIICGHFEGIDQRIIDKYKPIEISVGDYILSGGELSSMILIDSALRLRNNVLNSVECTQEESFNNNLLEYPQYTRPAVWSGLEVPKVLTSGDHKSIKSWREEQSASLTKKRRPDLIIKE